jgi:hypothetical protein
MGRISTVLIGAILADGKERAFTNTAAIASITEDMVKHINFRILKIIHAIVWAIWASLIFCYYDDRSQACFAALFGKYINYKIYNRLELIFMFGGGWLLLAALTRINKYFAYIFFELIFIGIIAIHLRIYFCK